MPRKPEIGATRESAVYQVRVPAPLKIQWNQHCAKQGTTPSAALRSLMRYIIKDDMPPEVRRWLEQDGEPDYGPKERLETRFTPSEFAALTARAASEGSSPQRWVANAVRASLTNNPQFMLDSTKTLRDSSRQLRAIGRNLNQIAKKLNQDQPVTVKTEQVDKLVAYIEAHTTKVGDLLDASLSRWMIQEEGGDGYKET
jgi:hypothetical protein